MATADLFTTVDTPAPASAPVKVPHTGLLVTNHLNLMYMLAAGLVMPPAGFGDKYYRDTLECFPGWIALFLGKPPRDAIASSTSEAGHLKAVVVCIDLSRLSGKLAAIGEDGVRELHFPDQLDGTERVLLVPAPLSTSQIESIVFQSMDDRKACERDAKEFGNVPLDDFKRRLSKTLFTKAPDTPWRLGEGPAERAVPWNAPSPPAASWRCCSSSATSASGRFMRAGAHSIRPTESRGRPATIRFSLGSKPGFERVRRQARRPWTPSRIGSRFKTDFRRGSSGKRSSVW